MSDSYTEVTQQSWFSRLKNAVVGVLLGLLLFFGSFPLLWWNEGRAVRTAKGLKELGGAVVAVAPSPVEPSHDKAAVHMTGLATTDETLADPNFPVSAKAISFRRKVEMYQWKQEEKSETRKKVGGGSETVTTYNYHQTWSDELIDSKRFKKPEGHTNPSSMRYPSLDRTAKLVKLGDFRLTPALIRQMDTYEPVPFTSDDLAKFRASHEPAANPPAGPATVATPAKPATVATPAKPATVATPGKPATVATPGKPESPAPVGTPRVEKEERAPAPEWLAQARVDGNTLYLPSSATGPAADPQSPQVGDLRISFQAVTPATVSIIARQTGDTFEPWKSQNGTEVDRLMLGEVSAEAMVGRMETENTILTWVLRLVGFVLMAIGLGLVFNPLSVLADVLPFLGSLMQMGIGLLAGLMAACLSLLTIGIAWLAYRPLLGGGLILAAVLVVLLIRSKRKPKPIAAQTV